MENPNQAGPSLVGLIISLIAAIVTKRHPQSIEYFLFFNTILPIFYTVSTARHDTVRFGAEGDELIKSMNMELGVFYLMY